MRTLIICVLLFVSGISNAQLKDEEGNYSLEIAKNKTFYFESSEYEVKRNGESKVYNGQIDITLKPSYVEFFQEEAFSINIDVTNIESQTSQSGEKYTVYTGMSYKDKCTCSVKWNQFSNQFYFEVEIGIGTENYQLYTFYKTKKATGDWSYTE